MADYLVHAGTARLWKTLIVQGSRNASMFHGEVMHYAVYLLGGHALTDACCHLVEHGCVQCTGTAYAFNLLGSLDKLPCGAQLATTLELQNAQVQFCRSKTRNQCPVLLYLILLCHVFYLYPFVQGAKLRFSERFTKETIKREQK